MFGQTVPKPFTAPVEDHFLLHHYNLCRPFDGDEPHLTLGEMRGPLTLP